VSDDGQAEVASPILLARFVAALIIRAIVPDGHLTARRSQHGPGNLNTSLGAVRRALGPLPPTCALRSLQFCPTEY
jgi:hypothetical protein